MNRDYWNAVANAYEEEIFSVFELDTGGLIRLEVAPQDVERAVEILEQDHSGTISDEDVGVAPPPPATTVCPRCGSASVVEDEPRRGSIIGIILAALRGRRKQCFTCGHRF